MKVTSVEFKDGKYFVTAQRTEGDNTFEGTHILSKPILEWFIGCPFVNDNYGKLDSTMKIVCEAYLKCHSYFIYIQVKLDKDYELLYTTNGSNVTLWVLIDEDLNVTVPSKLSVQDFHKLKYEAHYNEYTKNQPLNF